MHRIFVALFVVVLCPLVAPIEPVRALPAAVALPMPVARPPSTLVPIAGIQAITAGARHTCALTTAGGVQCWGDNAAGQLGDGTTTSQRTPVAVSNLATGIRALAAGGSHTCALTTGGAVKCWGDNSRGQLGDGTTTTRLTPVAVAGLTGAVHTVAAGNAHTCALMMTGAVTCWGSNHDGQLGDNTTDDRLTPVAVSGLESDGRAITAGGDHTCALIATGGAQCWGDNRAGQLGDGTTAIRLTPVAVNGLTGNGQAIAANRVHTCALMAAGAVRCWGHNATGQLGDGTTTNRLAPVTVSGLTVGIRGVAASSLHTCALTTAGGAMCWGYNDGGQLGDGTGTDRLTPVAVTGLASGVKALAGGGNHTCALMMSGGIKCWGDNGSGQLGDGTTADQLLPVAVIGLNSGVQAIAAGGFHTCALTTAGGVKCWGLNGSGQLGNGTSINRLTPSDAIGLTRDVQALAAGHAHTCALTAASGVTCWGWNLSGQLGDGTTAFRLAPVAVSSLISGVQAIDAGRAHTCAVTVSGGVACWGLNATGQLGDGTTVDRLTPVAVGGLGGAVHVIAAGGDHTCALTATGGVKCWGSNDAGQLGDGTTTNRLAPVDVLGLSGGVQAIAAGERHTCALMAAGSVQCWGDNRGGQLGDFTTTGRPVPVAVSGLNADIRALAAGSYHTCAATQGASVQCWGANAQGQLGDGTTIAWLAPVAVNGLSNGVSAVAAGGNHTCALATTGGVQCWGSNYYGQLGFRTGGLTDVGSVVHTLTVTKAGAGSGAVVSTLAGIHCGIDCAQIYAQGTVVTLTATAETGSLFSGWSGACPAAGQCALAMDASRQVTATFTQVAQAAIQVNGQMAAGHAVEFTATLGLVSVDACLWDFDDGGTAACQLETAPATGAVAQTIVVRATHIYAQPGQYVVTITASNPVSMAQASLPLTIQDAGNAEHAIYLPQIIR